MQARKNLPSHGRCVQAQDVATVAQEKAMNRMCPKCRAQMKALAVRCECGFEMPEATGVRCADPDAPVCGICSKEIQLTDQRCPHCGAEDSFFEEDDELLCSECGEKQEMQ